MSGNSENRRDTGDNGAREMLKDASEGRNISNQYNALSPQEQRAALTDMRNLQKADTASFGNVDLIDGNGDGILDDARSTDRAGGKTDVYDPNTRVLSQREISGDANLREADSILKSASQGQDVYGKIQRSHNPNLLDDLRAVQASKPQYGNVDIIDSNGDGQIDDVRALRTGRAGPQEVDVYKTPVDKERDRIEARTRQAIQNSERIILDGVLGDQGKRKGSTTERVGREGRRVVEGILKDMGKGR